MRQRESIKFKVPEEKKRAPRRKKDREDTDPRMRRDQRVTVVTTGDGGKTSPVKDQVVYTLGMSERDKRRRSDIPGPGTHEVKSLIGDAPNYKMGPPSKDVKFERDQTGPGSYEVTVKSKVPKYSFGTRTTVSLGFGPKQQFKSMRPGPGAHDHGDVQFKKPWTKFAQAAKQSLATMNGVPGPDVYNPSPVKIESNQFSFSHSQRLAEPGRDRNARKPGPGEYEVLNTLPKGQAKSMLGGSLEPPKIKDNGVPGPGNYFEDLDVKDHLSHVPGVRIVDKPPRFKEIEKEKEDENSKTKGKDQKEVPNPHVFVPGYSIGDGVREPLKNKFHTPAPNAYNVIEDNKAPDKYKFHMGIKTTYKANKGQETPGPGEYLTDLYEQIGPAHLIGTGQRSDLGVGKAYLAPGPGQYNVRGKFDGPKIKFGNETKNTKN